MKLDTKKIIVMRSDEAACIARLDANCCVIHRKEDMAEGEMTLLIFDHQNAVTSVMGQVESNARGVIKISFYQPLDDTELAFIQQFPTRIKAR